MTINRYTAWPEVGPFNAYYVELRDDPDGKLVLYDEVSHWLNPDAPLEEGVNPVIAFARRHSETQSLKPETARTIIRGLSNILERRDALVTQLTDALRMVRDADENCRLDGLPTIPATARAKIDAALTTAWEADKE